MIFLRQFHCKHYEHIRVSLLHNAVLPDSPMFGLNFEDTKVPLVVEIGAGLRRGRERTPRKVPCEQTPADARVPGSLFYQGSMDG